MLITCLLVKNWEQILFTHGIGKSLHTHDTTMKLAAISLAAIAVAIEGPCDITGRAGNRCVAAHSTVRALYGAYDGPLYKVTRSSDGMSANVGVLEAGGFANIKIHDEFCAKLDCVITNVFDQSPQGNHLYQRHELVNASRHKIIVGDGVSVYGMWFDPGYGYHCDNTTGMAIENEPQSIYAVMSGTRQFPDKGCCFDYGNSENSITAQNRSDGAGAMEAIYFGRTHWQGNSGDNSTYDGPWLGADLEAGMYYGECSCPAARPAARAPEARPPTARARSARR